MLFFGPFFVLTFAQKHKELFFYTVVWYILTATVIFLSFYFMLKY